MAHTYPDDVDKVLVLLNRERSIKRALVLASIVLLAVAALAFAQFDAYVPYGY